MKNPFILNLLFFLFSYVAHGQISQSLLADQDTHDSHKNELGIATSPVYFPKDQELAFGLHLHYVHTLFMSKFGLGLGYERIFDKHAHNTFGIVACYKPIEKLSLNISPGLTFEGQNNTANLSVHLESSYEWEIHDFHFGPVLEYAYDPFDYHLSIGMHFGYGF